jgi:hypothetical protein
MPGKVAAAHAFQARAAPPPYSPTTSARTSHASRGGLQLLPIEWLLCSCDDAWSQRPFAAARTRPQGHGVVGETGCSPLHSLVSFSLSLSLSLCRQLSHAAQLQRYQATAKLGVETASTFVRLTTEVLHAALFRSGGALLTLRQSASRFCDTSRRPRLAARCSRGRGRAEARFRQMTTRFSMMQKVYSDGKLHFQRHLQCQVVTMCAE